MSITGTENTEVFDYLDTLSETGLINMFGAGRYVVEAFECTKVEARELVAAWMKSKNQ
mgnify:CR=1 FL=1|tara:strand:+ start:2941 stop:3114 length:174 start_codon:yes stop_codon:yes gene_type:complete